MGPVVERLGGLLGGPPTLEELKHKPGRRRTFRARGGGRSAIVKVYASERASDVAARIAALAAGPAEPCVPEVLLVEPGLHLLVLSEVPGTPLRVPLLAADGTACRRAGAALGAWHRAWRGTRPAPLRPHTPSRELEILFARAEEAPTAIGRAVRSAAKGLGGSWPASGVVHRDLYEEQILLDERVGLIDLDDAALGPPELDIGNLVAHIELLAWRSGAGLEEPTRALLHGYAETGDPLDAALLDRCRKLALLRLGCIHQVPDLVEIAATELPA